MPENECQPLAPVNLIDHYISMRNSKDLSVCCGICLFQCIVLAIIEGKKA